MNLILALRLDALAWKLLRAARYYPFNAFLYWLYASVCILTVPFAWALIRMVVQRVLSSRLESAFQDAGLISRTKKLPGFISDYWIDDNTKKLTLASGGLTKADFVRAKENLQSSLNVYIDEIKHQIDSGKVELVYSYEPMPTFMPFDATLVTDPLTFLVGWTRTKPLYASLRDIPHILLAGLTNSGKSSSLVNTMAKPISYPLGMLTKTWDGRVQQQPTDTVYLPAIDFAGTLTVFAVSN